MSISCEYGKLARSCNVCDLEKEIEALRACLRWHIRVFVVPDESWSPDSEVERWMEKSLAEFRK